MTPPEDTSDRRVGARFGEYLVEALLGRGGMGVVFRARHVVTDQVVALKLMAPDLADNPTFRERFVREAEAGPSLGHPNIVRVFESGEADGDLFIAMELIEGTDLKRLIHQEGPLDPKRVLSIFGQAASALDAAHESGMVHRDVKPQNILVIPRETPQGIDRVYLTDFGLVRPVASETSASRTGQVFGSVAYMAPELIEGIPADGRADVYALGCVAYEALTGSVPFERENEVAAVWAHIHEDPPLVTDTRRDLPAGLNDPVFKAMAKHPDDRFLTCGEFMAELEAGLGRKLSALKHTHVRPLIARIPRRKTEREVWSPNFFPELSRVRGASRRGLDWRKVVAFAAVLALLSTIQIGRDGGLPQAVADVADAADSVVEAVIEAEPEPKDAGSEMVATDPTRQGGDRVAKAIAPSDRRKLRDLLPADRPAETAGNPGSARQPSNDAFLDRETGKIVFSRIEEDPHWAAGGLQTNADIWVMNFDGSNETRLTLTAEAEFWPTWSPGGSHIAYVRIDQVDGTHEIWIMDSNGDDQRDLGLCPGTADCGKLAWSRSGVRVAYVQGTDLYVADLTTGTRTRVVSGGVTPPSRPRDGDAPGPTWSPDGRSLAYSCGEALCVVSARGGDPRVMAQKLTDPDWSPTGKWVVGTRDDDLFMIRSDGTGLRPLRDHSEGGTPAWGSSPTWGPSGEALAYSTGGGLFRIDRDGRDRVQLSAGRIFGVDWWGDPPR